nr:helix-turn-helix transcriptional regulator [uncultured Halomonas sp.]
MFWGIKGREYDFARSGLRVAGWAPHPGFRLNPADTGEDHRHRGAQRVRQKFPAESHGGGNRAHRRDSLRGQAAVDADFGLSQLADQLFISERQLQRKCKSVFNLTPNAYIRNYRLQKARQLLEQGERVSLVVEQCGFSSHSYFSQCFKALFNVTPSEFIDRHPRH